MTLEKKSITRNDVARAAGVSPATVSYVINNGPRPVASETRQKVLDVIQQLGYHPNAVARNLRMQKTSTIGLILPDNINPYFAEVARGVEQMAFERGYSVLLCHSDYKIERELQYVDVLRAERVAGVIWFPATSGAEPGKRLVDYGIPLVVLDRTVDGLQPPTVLSDNYRGGYIATQHLIQFGHRRIGCITRPTGLYHSQERVKGYLGALRENGIESDPELLVKGGFLMEDGRKAAIQLLDLNPAPTAIFSYNDFMAIGALRAAVERGVSVPKDLSIVGFDDIPQDAFTCPALTTIRQPKIEMGRQGVELLIDQVEGKPLPAQSGDLLGVALVIRESTAAAPHR